MLVIKVVLILHTSQVDDDVFVNTDQVWSTLESSHLYSTSMAVEGKDGALVNTNLDYAIIGHVMHTVPIRWQFEFTITKKF